MTSPRQKYRAEYKTLLELQRTIAFRSAGFVSAIAAMNSTELGPATLQEIKKLADEYEKVSEEIKHLQSLLDLMDNDEATDPEIWS